MIHHLTEKDTGARTGRCSVCGPVGIRKAGTGWTCAERQKAANRASKRRHPRREHRGANPHRLTEKNPRTRTAVCVKDGTTSIVPWGRGWICAERAKELGRVTVQTAPLAYCRDCRAEDDSTIWLLADGSCPRCSSGKVLSQELKRVQDYQQAMAAAGLGAGFHLEPIDPYAMPEYESAVPGWRTLGARA